jgi:penicillin-binding protein 1A
MFKNSGLYNPIRNPEGVTNRRNVVLANGKRKIITKEEKKNYKVYRLN